ncbi:Hypothetical predicted protein [Lecanosticta acicola]|uniref:Uncharacterized protein n=1 Tax=Lecanosticta acicola TaxID=111012 RepID=A0AAI9EEZ9_9PEZI|nr:Hypothetical predicted protein [Lecanosticta acicola]
MHWCRDSSPTAALSRSPKPIVKSLLYGENAMFNSLITAGIWRRDLGLFFLIGFEQVRSAEGIMCRRGDMDWNKNLYRQYARQGLSPEEKYSMQHEIYSLDVCMLEIGLWDSFLLYYPNGRVKTPHAALLGLSTEKLTGDLYVEVAMNCLKCLNEDNMDIADEGEFDVAGGGAVGVRYIEKVVQVVAGLFRAQLTSLGRFS